LKRQGVKKPHTVSAKTTGRKAAGKRKKPRRLTLQDKLRALLVAAVVVLVAALFSAAMHVQAARARLLSPQAVAHVTQAAEEAAATSAAQTAATAPQAAIAPTQQAVPPSPPPLPPPPPPTPPPLPALPSAYIPAIREQPPQPEPGSRGALVFVIDDAGHNLRDLQPFLNFPGPLTIAVLPGLPYSAEAARLVRAAGKELLLHQPMESVGGTDPGPGAIMAGMGGDEIRSIINRNLDEVWPVAGMNNHEGSRITADEQAMQAILAVSRERGILFLDSRTTAETAAPRVARQLGITIGERDIFVDNVQDRESMLYFINRGLLRAEQSGFAVMLGHVWSPELAPLLMELYADLTARGYTFSSVADIIALKNQRN